MCTYKTLDMITIKRLSTITYKHSVNHQGFRIRHHDRMSGMLKLQNRSCVCRGPPKNGGTYKKKMKETVAAGIVSRHWQSSHGSVARHAHQEMWGALFWWHLDGIFPGHGSFWLESYMHAQYLVGFKSHRHKDILNQLLWWGRYGFRTCNTNWSTLLIYSMDYT